MTALHCEDDLFLQECSIFFQVLLDVMTAYFMYTSVTNFQQTDSGRKKKSSGTWNDISPI